MPGLLRPVTIQAPYCFPRPERPSSDITIGFGDNQPAPTWSFPFDIEGSDFELTITYRGRDTLLTSRNGDLVVSNAINTVTWAITIPQSKLFAPGSFVTYRLRRIVPGGEDRTYARGQVLITLDPILPDAVRVVDMGPQGATGRIGSVGPAGPFSPGFGFANYADGQFTQASPLLIPGGAAIPMPIDGLGQGSKDELRGVFAGWPLWSGNRFAPRAANDNYLLRVNFTAQPSSINNALKITVNVSNVGAVFEQIEVFGVDAGQYRDFSFPIPIFVDGPFVQNGASIRVTPAADMTLWGASIEIMPLGSGH